MGGGGGGGGGEGREREFDNNYYTVLLDAVSIPVINTKNERRSEIARLRWMN